jgi:hypothetical protein
MSESRIKVDIGERCTHCGDSVSFGDGKFVNRIGSGSEWKVHTSGDEILWIDVDGWMCEECQELECDECGEPIPVDEDVYIEHPILHALHVHETCVRPAWKEFVE